MRVLLGVIAKAARLKGFEELVIESVAPVEKMQEILKGSKMWSELGFEVRNAGERIVVLVKRLTERPGTGETHGEEKSSPRRDGWYEHADARAREPRSGSQGPAHGGPPREVDGGCSPGPRTVPEGPRLRHDPLEEVDRPLAGTDAFGRLSGRTWYHALNWRVGADGVPEDISRWTRVEDPDLWDMPDDGDLYQVGVACWGVRPWVNAVLVSFAENQPWDSPLQSKLRTTFRSVMPAEQDFWMGDANFVVLDATTVVESRIRLLGS